ncbi:MAG: nitrite reductase small subunit NirD [Spongiibacteraceae bacterium]
MSNHTETNWVDICNVNDIVPNTGRCALFNNEQVAIFRINYHGNDEIYAVHNFDPFSKANVLARGITGSVVDTLVVASPIYKQHFCLQTGKCLEDETALLKTYKARIVDNTVQLSA